MTVFDSIETKQLTASNFKIGSLVTPAGSEVIVEFPQAFNAGSYAIFFTPAATNTVVDGAFTSGALRASGCTVIGTASTGYNYLAIGV